MNNNYSYRELPKQPGLNIDELIERTRLKKKTSREKLSK